jgi:hypothetical protein
MRMVPVRGFEPPVPWLRTTWHWTDRKAADDFVAKNTPTKTI